MKLIFASTFLLLIFNILPAQMVTVDDSIPSGSNYKKAGFRLWYRENAGTIKGVVVLVPGSNSDGRDWVTDTCWQKLANRNGLALLGCYFTDFQHDNMAIEQYANAGEGSGQALLNVLKRFAKRTNHDELPEVPLFLWGISAGGEFNYEFVCWKPERVAAFVVNKGGVYYTTLCPDEARKVPGLFFTGEKDMEYRSKVVEGIFSINRRFGALWAFIKEPAVGHDIGRSQSLSVSFFDDIARSRIPESEMKNRQSILLQPVALENSFIGDPVMKDFISINDWKGTGYPTSWLPSENFAKQWLSLIKGDCQESGVPAPMSDNSTSVYHAEKSSFALVDPAKINPRWLNDHWEAEWITHPTASILEYGVFHFRKSFQLKEKPAEFIIHVSADNRYRLYINGTDVCFGPARGDPAHWFFESVDIAPYLKSGTNTIAAVVWNFGENKPWGQFSLKTAFIVQGNNRPEAVINTNASWKVVRNSAYTPASAGSNETYGQFVVVGPCDRVNAALYPWGWELPGYNDKSWSAARSIDVGHPYGVGTDINWVLTPRRIPLMEQLPSSFKRIRLVSGTDIPAGFPEGLDSIVLAPHRNVVLLLDQGNLTTGYPQLIVSGGKGSSIKITYAESLFDTAGQKGNRNEIEGKSMTGYADFFLPDGLSRRMFRPLWFRTWRYVQLDISTGNESLTLHRFNSIFSAYPFRENASFDSDREDLKHIWNIGWRTARLCANETYFDCPYYEQLQYAGDTRIQALISLYVSGDDRLMRNAIQQFDESRNHEGITQSRYPSASPQFIPPYSLFWIAMVHDYWMLRNNPEFVMNFLPGIRTVLAWYNRYIDRNTGLLGRVPYWNFVDWAKEWPWIAENRIGGVPQGGQKGNSSVLTLQYAYALEKAGELFCYFGYPEQAAEYSRLAKELATKVYETCWDASRHYLADTPDKKTFSMHAQIFGILTQAIPEDQKQSFTLRFMNDSSLIQPTLYFRFYLTQALEKAGLADRYPEILGLWNEMVAKGLTTFAENPDPSRSDCHAWSASPNYDLLATVAGIRSSSPGFKTIMIKPALGELRFIRGRMPHPRGFIDFDLKRNGATGLTGTIKLPEGVTGLLQWKDLTVFLKDLTEIDL